MNGEYNWNAEKRDLKKLPSNKLQEKLQELHKQKMKMEIYMYSTGSYVRSYPPTKQEKPVGNLNKIRKSIAYVKTLLNVKLKHTQNGPIQ